MNEQRPHTVREIRQAKKITSRQLADAAGVSLRVEYLLEIGCKVTDEERDQILRALSALTGQVYAV
jgi:transcriptional regulator with XRE-family HTH domain